MDTHTLLYLKWITDKVLVYIAHGTLLDVMCQTAREVVWGRKDICIAESLCCPGKTITTLLIGYILT